MLNRATQPRAARTSSHPHPRPGLTPGTRPDPRALAGPRGPPGGHGENGPAAADNGHGQEREKEKEKEREKEGRREKEGKGEGKREKAHSVHSQHEGHGVPSKDSVGTQSHSVNTQPLTRVSSSEHPEQPRIAHSLCDPAGVLIQYSLYSHISDR